MRLLRIFDLMYEKFMSADISLNYSFIQILVSIIRLILI